VSFLSTIPSDRLADFCRRWQVHRLSIFGSAVRDQLRSDSDIDVLVAFDERAVWSLFDIITMREELAALFGRAVDLVEEGAVRNPYLLASIDRTKQVLYAA